MSGRSCDCAAGEFASLVLKSTKMPSCPIFNRASATILIKFSLDGELAMIFDSRVQKIEFDGCSNDFIRCRNYRGYVLARWLLFVLETACSFKQLAKALQQR